MWYSLTFVSSDPKWCDTPLALSFTQARLCDTPFCNILRDNCAIPTKKQAPNSFAILSLQVSRDMKSIAVGPLRSGVTFPGRIKNCWNFPVFSWQSQHLILALIMVPSLSRCLWQCCEKLQVATRANDNGVFISILVVKRLGLGIAKVKMNEPASPNRHHKYSEASSELFWLSKPPPRSFHPTPPRRPLEEGTSPRNLWL